MADPAAATITQLKNIQSRTGKSIAELHAALAASGAAKHAERRTWLMQQFKLGYGDANAVVSFIDKPMPDLGGGTQPSSMQVDDSDPLASIYTGTKAALRPLHDVLMAQIRTFGAFELAPKKSYVSLRLKKQFAMVGPATKDSVEIGLNVRDLPAHARLKVQPPGSMCHATTRITNAAEVDALLIGWLRQAYDAAR
jgi:hypothetical protein